MFCQKGSTALADPNNPGSLTFSGLDRDNLILRVQGNISDCYVELTFQGGSSFRVYGVVPEFFHVPANSSSVSYSVGGNSSARVSLALGMNI